MAITFVIGVSEGADKDSKVWLVMIIAVKSGHLSSEGIMAQKWIYAFREVKLESSGGIYLHGASRLVRIP